jgi:hypothetical protein
MTTLKNMVDAGKCELRDLTGTYWKITSLFINTRTGKKETYYIKVIEDDGDDRLLWSGKTATGRKKLKEYYTIVRGEEVTEAEWNLVVMK